MKKLFPLLGLIIITQHLFGQFQSYDSATDQDLYDVYFIDENIGLAVGDLGTIVRSIDGGLSWSLIMSNDTVSLKKVKFLDELNGIAIGSHIFRTNDAGLTWTAMPHPNNQFYDLEVVNQTTCIISGEPVALIKSIDGGQSFADLIVENTDSNFGLLSFVDENIGYTCQLGGGYSSRTLKTADGGITWSTIEATGYNPTVMEAMCFISEDTGFKAGWYNSHLQKTTDGAYQWTDVMDSGSYYQILDFHIKASQPDAYYACGWYGEIIKSTDGGSNWFKLESGLPDTTSLYGICFIDDNTGWAVGRQGTLIKTTNGGGVSGTVESAGPASAIHIYPNPTRGDIHIEYSHPHEILAISLLSEHGQVIKSFEPFAPANLDGLPHGSYFIRFETTKGIRVKKIFRD